MHVQRARVWVCAAHLVAWVHRHIVRQRGGVGGIACRHLALRAAERHPRPCGWSMSHAEVSSGSKWWAPAFVIGTVKGASKHQARKNKKCACTCGLHEQAAGEPASRGPICPSGTSAVQEWPPPLHAACAACRCVLHVELALASAALLTLAGALLLLRRQVELLRHLPRHAQRSQQVAQQHACKGCRVQGTHRGCSLAGAGLTSSTCLVVQEGMPAAAVRACLVVQEGMHTWCLDLVSAVQHCMQLCSHVWMQGNPKATL